MIADRQYLFLVRLVLQTEAPLAIGTGRGNGVFDNQIVRDANGLAALPGSSTAGMLRALYADSVKDQDLVEALFGGVGDVRDAKGTLSSPLQISWGSIHDSRDQPVHGLLVGAERGRIYEDPVLFEAFQETPVRRNRVRMNHRGVAADTGQFDRVALQAGHRFSLEMAHWSTEADHCNFDKLLKLIGSRRLYLGGSTRAGFGAVRLVRAHERRFDLGNPDDFAAYARLSNRLDDVGGMTRSKHNLEAEQGLCATLALTPVDGYRFGGGEQPLKHDMDRPPDLIPVTEQVVVWKNGQGQMEDRLFTPATSIKGALRHRFAFHYNRFTDTWADDVQNEDQRETEANAGVKHLFGFANEQDNGQPGRLMLEDVYLPLPERNLCLTHNGIDRFTGGVRHGVLYSEQVVAEPLTFRLRIDHPSGVEENARHALRASLEDLIRGRLSLGASGARGWGVFKGSIAWSDNAQWIQGG